MREIVVEVYLVTSISLMGALLVAVRLLQDLPVVVSIFAPILSVSIFMLVRSHYVAIEKLSEFIRYAVNDKLVALGVWTPYWDHFDRQGDTGIGASLDKTRSRWAAHAVSMHAPSAVSMCFFFYFAFQLETQQLSWHDVIWEGDAIAFYFAVLIFGYALWCTFSTLSASKRRCSERAFLG